MKQTLKQITPPFLWNFARATNDSIRRLPELPAAYLHPWRRESIRRLAALKDLHKGKRAFVIANGPSLKQTDMSMLKNELTFGVNRIYLMFPELGFSTTYLTVVNDLVIEQTASDLAALSLPKFLAWRSRRHFPKQLPITQLPTFLYTSYTGPHFSTDVRGRVWEGATVTNVTLQLAFHMGFQQVILIGVDHNYTATGKPNTTVVSQGDLRGPTSAMGRRRRTWCARWSVPGSWIRHTTFPAAGRSLRSQRWRWPADWESSTRRTGSNA